MPGDGWTVDTYEAVLTVDRALLPAFTKAVTDAIWQRLQSVLTRLQREDVQSLVVEGDSAPLPAVPPDWRNQTAEPDPPVVRRLRIGPPTTEFNVALQDFSVLGIRGHRFPDFYDTRRGRLITEFLLDDRPQVATLCHVTLINKDGVLSPRIKLWKKDKTRLQGQRPWRRSGPRGPQIVKALVTPVMSTRTSGRSSASSRAASGWTSPEAACGWLLATKPSWLGSWPTRTARRSSKPSGPLSAVPSRKRTSG